MLGHALYMKAIHGGKSKNDRIDSHKIATLLLGGMLPQAYVYPREMRATRDLLRRRLFFARKRAELLSHIQNTNTQYNLPAFEARIDRPANRETLIEHFEESSVQMSIACNMALLDRYEEVVHELELYRIHKIREDRNDHFFLLRTIPGIGEILSLTLLYEIHDIARFPRVGDFLSYARLVKGTAESAGKKQAGRGKKIGNVHPRLSFEEADLAHLAAAALALAERPRRFRFQAGADGRLHLIHDGACAGTAHSPVLEQTSLATDFTRLADLRAQPLALAQLLAAVPAGVLERAGAILMDELRKARRSR